jgi:hypothetical protein
MYKLKNHFDVDFQTEEVYKYLFTASWNKEVIDKTRHHDYRGFSESLIETKNDWIVNVANYTGANGFGDKLDKTLSNILNSKVETNFVSILPRMNVGRHWDVHTGPCNTSIVWKVFGNTEVTLETDEKIYREKVNPEHGLILNTDLIHDAYNNTRQIQWLATSLVYNITYDEVIEICKEQCLLL